MGGPAEMDTTEDEVQAKRCRFDTTDLRWLPVSDEVVKVRLFTEKAGTRKLAIGAAEVKLAEVRSAAHPAPTLLVLDMGPQGQAGLLCEDAGAAKAFFDELLKMKNNYERFEQYEQGSVQSYFQYYAKCANQQNMLQDHVRTSLYREAIIENPEDFRDAKVMDLGAGSGILSFFAAQAGATTVYPVEASSMSEVVQTLADSNKKSFPLAKFKVINKPIEKVSDEEVPEKVDCIVSEPIGTFLFNERMIESYLVARDRFLKPGGKMFPNIADLCVAPFSDPTLHFEQSTKDTFWKTNCFYGLDLSAVQERCQKEHFRQPVVDYINPEFLVAEAKKLRFDFATCSVESLHNIEIPFDFEISQPCLVHGVAGWFDAFFEGSNRTVLLSTAPWCPGTHWYQIRFLLERPLAVNPGQHLVGTLKMEANNLQSYYVSVKMTIAGTNISSEAKALDLKDPEYRFYSSPQAYVPPGTANIWANQPGQQGQAQQQQGTQAGVAQQQPMDWNVAPGDPNAAQFAQIQGGPRRDVCPFTGAALNGYRPRSRSASRRVR
eukprot:TRINITY_DN1517_c0_g1_i5.p1 TRINITY_DN1517_c0_g1~~TRINITY_DN1517_c0_g1_i5.p1  ORF type:complete len:547 (+),score=148.56 TRINITY_DN1517_c0_g1_i5:95-1735(+)